MLKILSDTDMNAKLDDIKFDDALRQLEEINSKLERGNLEIEEALKLYKEGVKLYKLCQQKLKEAKATFEEIEREMGVRNYE